MRFIRQIRTSADYTSVKRTFMERVLCCGRTIGHALRDNYQGVAVMKPFDMKGIKTVKGIKVWRDIVPDTSEVQWDKNAVGSVSFVCHV